MSTPANPPVVRRHSLLRRNTALTREQFSRHYEHHHGPLAAGLAGFRRFTSRYVQNHVEELPGAAQPPLDGVTMTTQVPREDYRQGFFNDPDYAKVKPDELYLFDIASTVSVLGREEIAIDPPAAGDKALVLMQAGTADLGSLPGLVRLVLNHLDRASASALGFGASRLEHDLLAELWFERGARTGACRRLALEARPGVAAPLVLPVREVLIFGPEKPWRVA